MSKLYKKEAKYDKLLSIILKYVQSANLEEKENQIMKTLLLIVSLFRKGPNAMNHPWEEIINTAESISKKSTILVEICNFCRQKISVNNKLKALFRGNFFIEELSKFKNVTC